MFIMNQFSIEKVKLIKDKLYKIQYKDIRMKKTKPFNSLCNHNSNYKVITSFSLNNNYLRFFLNFDLYLIS